MKEIEVKILEVNPAEIRKKLKALGAEKFFEGEVHSISYDYPDHRLEKAGLMLRVRKAGDRAELCFKGKNESARFKAKEEIEVLTSSFEDTCTILERVGFKRLYEQTKKRECYRLGSVKYDLDMLPGIPPYLEVEAATEAAVEQAVKDLGFTMQQTTNKPGRRVEADYRSGTRP